MATGMTDYEQQAWEKLIADERSRREGWRARGAEKVSELVSVASGVVQKIPGAARVTDALDDTMKVALNGIVTAAFMPAIASVSIERRTRALRKRHPDIGDASPFEVLDLKALDKGRPKQLLPFIGAAESIGASLAITGFEVSTTVTGGASAGAIVLAIVGDVGASLVLLGRAVAEVAVHYGYDTSEPDEEIFLMAVLSYGTAASVKGKAASLASLSRLSQKMMRKATMKQLEKESLVKVIQAVFSSIGIKLTHKRLSLAVPVVGGVISAGLSFDMLNRALRDATRIYRVRYLADKYGLSFDDWVERVTATDAESLSCDDAFDEDPIDVEKEVRVAIEQHEHTDPDEALRTADAP